MWFVPTRGRPHRLQKFLDACVEAEMSMPGLIMIDGLDGGDYSDVKIPDNWEIERADMRGDVGGCLDNLFEAYPNEEFYSIINDDVVPETHQWDLKLAEEFGDGWNFIYPNDCLQGENRATQMVIGGNLARAVGSLSFGFLHGKMDRAWMETAEGIGRLRYRDDVRLRHEHFSVGFERDETYNRSYNGVNTVKRDGLRWKYWELERHGLIERLREEMPQ